MLAKRMGLSNPTNILLNWFGAVWGWQNPFRFWYDEVKRKWGRIRRKSTPFATHPWENLPHFLILRCPTKYPYDELKQEWGLPNPTLNNLLNCAKSAWNRLARSEVDFNFYLGLSKPREKYLIIWAIGTLWDSWSLTGFGNKALNLTCPLLTWNGEIPTLAPLEPRWYCGTLDCQTKGNAKGGNIPNDNWVHFGQLCHMLARLCNINSCFDGFLPVRPS